MPKSIAHTYVGLDVSSASIQVALLRPGGEIDEEKVPNTAEAVRALVRRWGQPATVRACYEAGPNGYELQRRPTFAPATPPILRVRWIYLSDKKSLQVQEDGNPGLLKEARLPGPAGNVVASGTAHLATPGEPRQCISSVVSPPLVVALTVGPDVASALRPETPVYTLEVRDDLSWYEVELFDWSKIAGGYCVQ